MLEDIKKFFWKKINMKLVSFYSWVIFLLFMQVYYAWKGEGQENDAAYFFELIFLISSLFLVVFLSAKLITIFFSREKEWKLSFLLLVGVFFIIVMLAVQVDVIYKLDFSKWKYFFISFKNIFLPLFWSGIFFLSSTLLGQKILSIFKFKNFSFIEGIMLSLGLGMGAIHYLIFLLAVTKLAYPIVAYLLFFGIILLFRRKAWEWWEMLVNKKISLKINKEDVLNVGTLLLIGGLFLITFIYSSANILNGFWDTFHQYLTFPATYAENHQLIYFPYHPHWGFPQMTEMLYLSGILLGGTAVPFILNYFWGILTWVTFSQIAKKFGSKYILWLMAIAVSVPIFLHIEEGYLKVELLHSFYTALSFLVLYHFFQDFRNEKLVFILAIFLGLSLAVKYTSIFVILAFMVILFFMRKEINLFWRNFFVSGVIIFILLIPWATKNWIYYQNIFYPIWDQGQDVFQKELGLKCSSYFVRNCSDDMPSEELYYKFSSPVVSNFLVTIKHAVGSQPINIINPGPWFLAFSFFFLFSFFSLRNNYLKFLYYFSFLFSIFYLVFMASQTWYLLPVILALLIILGYILEKERLLDKFKFLKSFIIFWLIFNVSCLIIYSSYKKKISYIRGETSYRQSLVEFKKRYNDSARYNWIKNWEFLNERLKGEDGLVYGFLDTQGYFILNSHKNFIPDFFGYLAACMEEQGGIYPSLKKLGVKYIITDRDYKDHLKFCREKKIMARSALCRAEQDFDEFIEIYGERIFRSGSIAVYQLK